MKIVIDTNVLISALIRDSITRKIIVESGWEFYYPEDSIHEVREHKDLILKKSGLSEYEYTKCLNKLLNYVNLVSKEQTAFCLDQASNEIGKTDPDDVVFLAAALILDHGVIWSNDK